MQKQNLKISEPDPSTRTWKVSNSCNACPRKDKQQ